MVLLESVLKDEGKIWDEIGEGVEEQADVSGGVVDESEFDEADVGVKEGLIQTDENFRNLLQFRCCGQSRLMRL